MLHHQVDIFMHVNAPRHRASRVSIFFGRKIYRYWIGQETVRISTHRKCMIHSEAGSRANAPQGTRRSRKKKIISIGECYNTRIMRETSYVNARQNSRSNQKPRRSY